ncbi:MAG: DUF4037 domain-containing protein, partial [Thermomicrobiales bacterium]
PILRAVLRAETWQERQHPLGIAYETVAHIHNALGITAPLDPRTGHYHGRPFKDAEGRPFTVIHAERFADAIRQTIGDDLLREVASYTGAVDQWADSTDVLSHPARIARLRSLFTDELPRPDSGKEPAG